MPIRSVKTVKYKNYIIEVLTHSGNYKSFTIFTNTYKFVDYADSLADAKRKINKVSKNTRSFGGVF